MDVQDVNIEDLCSKLRELLDIEERNGIFFMTREERRTFQMSVDCVLDFVKESQHKTLAGVMDVVLEDDDTPYGGVAYPGETVRDFLFTIDRDNDEIKTIQELNEALQKCGIKPVE